MKIKSFIIRLNSDFYSSDQEKINSFLENVNFVKSSVSFVDEKSKFWTILIHYKDSDSTENGLKFKDEDTTTSQTQIISIKAEKTELNPEQTELAQHLKEWRRQRGEKERLPLFMIITNSDIEAIAKVRPSRIEDFFGLKGFGERKIARYGEEIIALLNSVA